MGQTFCADRLMVTCCADRAEMGRAAAKTVCEKIKELLMQKAEVNILFAAAPSQNELLAELKKYRDIPWERVNALHMDEYVGLALQAPQCFSNFLRARIWGALPFRAIHALDGTAPNVEAECRRYADLLRQYPLDIACAGIGENGHIAFNDPHVADFEDPRAVKPVMLDDACRLQQVHDGCFGSLEEVPKQAITLTIPSIFKAGFIVCSVPGTSKAQAVYQTVVGPVEKACPASILRRHHAVRLYLDTDSAALLP